MAAPERAIPRVVIKERFGPPVEQVIFQRNGLTASQNDATPTRRRIIPRRTSPSPDRRPGPGRPGTVPHRPRRRRRRPPSRPPGRR